MQSTKQSTRVLNLNPNQKVRRRKMFRKNLAVVLAVFLIAFILWYSGPGYAWEEEWRKVEIHKVETYKDVDVRNLFKVEAAKIPDPVSTWQREKAIHDIKRGFRTNLAIIGLGAWPSYPGAVGFASGVVKDFSPPTSSLHKGASIINDASTAWDWVNPVASVDSKLFSAGSYAAGNSVFSSDFDANAIVTHHDIIPLDRSWDNGYSRGWMTGTVEFTKTFKPDSSLWHRDTFLHGSYLESFKLLQDITKVEKTGFGDIPASLYRDTYNSTKFDVPKFNTYQPPTFNTYQSPTFNTYKPTPHIYMPPRIDTYNPPPLPPIR